MEGQSRKRAPFLLGQAFRSVIGSPSWPVVLILGPAHELCVVCSGRAFVGKPVREGPRVYELTGIIIRDDNLVKLGDIGL